ncbi:MAG: histidine kinase [Pyrinomonadaceae bacterium]|nr:histidine kinase [Pyrinomonadaceae bacterium]
MRKGVDFTKRFFLIYCLAWVPYAISYIAVFLTESTLGFLDLILMMSLSIVPAAILGIGVVGLCNKFDWSLHRRIWFFPLHILLALTYSVTWTGVLFLLLTLVRYSRTGVWSPISFAGFGLSWQIFSGLMLYATIASIIYVAQVVQNLREEERRAARAEALYTQNALAALQAQLNPHFLFNTLHSLMALVRYKPEIAENGLEKLAELLRYSLKDKREAGNYMVRLEDELRFVDNYLELEKLRLGERLTVNKRVAPETNDCLLPAFTIQPLVENSIKHGIAPRNVAATIFLSAEKKNASLVLQVGDDGIGSELNELDDNDGLGLNLVREQLRLQYGDDANFEIQTLPEKGFKVGIELPFRTSPEA